LAASAAANAVFAANDAHERREGIRVNIRAHKHMRSE
jgi:hypothetical protein